MRCLLTITNNICSKMSIFSSITRNSNKSLSKIKRTITPLKRKCLRFLVKIDNAHKWKNRRLVRSAKQIGRSLAKLSEILWSNKLSWETKLPKTDNCTWFSSRYTLYVVVLISFRRKEHLNDTILSFIIELNVIFIIIVYNRLWAENNNQPRITL